MHYYKEMAKQPSLAESLVRNTDARDCDLGHGEHKGCVKVVCDLGAYNCSYSHNLDKAVQLCQGGARSSCIEDMCSTGAYNCSYAHNVDKVLELCKR